jgi:AcrR family transcriptional regulator
MSSNNQSDDAMEDMFVVEKPQAVRLIFSEKHNLILKLITEKEMSISDVARSLGINPGSAHYYLKELEKHGLARQVRQEIKGGVVKKYYRATARRIVLASPDFSDPVFQAFSSEQEIGERFVGAIESFGYHIPPGDRDEARELVIRYERRIKELFRELSGPGSRREGADTPDFRIAGQFLVHMRGMDDPELLRLYSQFRKLFMPVE